MQARWALQNSAPVALLLQAHARNGDCESFRTLFGQMQWEGSRARKRDFVGILRSCAAPKALAIGRLCHDRLAENGMDLDVVVGTALVGMYGRCGGARDARRMFDKMGERNAVSWNVLIGIYAQRGRGEEGFRLLQQMQQEGVDPNNITYVNILNGFTGTGSLALGKLVHAHAFDRGIEPDVFVRTALLTMYTKCGSIRDARTVFDKNMEGDVVLWTTMIAGYARSGRGEEALKLLRQMQESGLKPNKVTFINILDTGAGPDALAIGKLVHAQITDGGIESDIVVRTAILNMYCKCGSIRDAQRMFDNMRERDVVSWTAMIAGYARRGYGEAAFKLFHQMQQEGVKPNRVTFISVLNACASQEALIVGKLVHAQIIHTGIQVDVIVGNAVVSMYGRCGSVDDAKRMFDKMPEREVVSWTAMITGYAQNGCAEGAFELFEQMKREGVNANKATFLSLLDACAGSQRVAMGKVLHAQIVDSGFQSDVVVGTAVVSMYCKCGNVADAHRIFEKMPERDEVSWAAMISGYAQNGYDLESFALFKRMKVGGMYPTKITFISLLNACDSPDTLDLGRLIHDHISKSELEFDVVVGNALISMYGLCGSIEDARRTFENMPEQDVVSWNAMISGYIQHGYCEEALKLFQQMQQNGVNPDKVTCTSILVACATLTALVHGKLVHAYIGDRGIKLDVELGNAMINMYGKCGSVSDACRMFDEMPERNVVSWSAMIAAYAQHGYGEEALQFFQQMQEDGIIPDEITLISVLYACSHAGLVEKGLHYFNSMIQDHGIVPTVKHYNSVVDLLGRAGQLDEAEDFINKMPLQPDAVTWMSLLGSCRAQGCIERAKHAAESAIELDVQLSAAYVVLSNICAAAGRWGDVAIVRKAMTDREVKKEPGCSWIEVNNRVHEFVSGDTSHPQTEEIYAELERLTEEVKNAGYVSDTMLALHDVKVQNGFLSHYHSEKLAISFGLLSTPRVTPLHIVKNLRVCWDCHNVIKFISKITMREIVVRDASRFHHIKDGMCSCADYW